MKKTELNIGNMQITTKDFSDEVKEALIIQCETGLEKIGLVGEGYAKIACPVDTGNLRNSISHSADEKNAYIGTNVEYAPYVELGARGRKEKPFLRKAASEHGEEYKQILKDALRS